MGWTGILFLIDDSLTGDAKDQRHGRTMQPGSASCDAPNGNLLPPADALPHEFGGIERICARRR